MAVVMEENANPMKFEKLFKVTPEMIDENKHMNNVWAVQWVQDISIAHSDSVGATDVMYQFGCGWMIHTQFVEYKNQAFLGDEIRGTTWVMIDENKHMNNVWAVQWVQDISIAHSDSVGATDVMYQFGCGWMIHTQFVEYKNQAFLGDEIRGTTWVAGYSKVMSVRKCRFERVSDGKVVFESETQWVLKTVSR